MAGVGGRLKEVRRFHHPWLYVRCIALGTAGICLLSAVWLQVAPTALENIGWRYYLCFIIPSSIAAVLILRYWPDTNGMPLEEAARLFGDEDEMFGNGASVENRLAPPSGGTSAGEEKAVAAEVAETNVAGAEV
ncbi:hypothetical protein B0T26DRAFT_718123 [Lasiosphaeria miniovina]|uniref:Uncharacterized protein n=1 Tax=Lasiosphaeria miniovina TaxID=1954250 RepID=A0AA40DUI2_9PEZI|nr:uncharacterized protein B0T26DRAFT_718123 [Lasiosphaeria miniovina]KAK0713691.1 hypothetical protein B0T26DRAFT_718123 [Lasiosphaeria miniovina]